MHLIMSATTSTVPTREDSSTSDNIRNKNGRRWEEKNNPLPKLKGEVADLSVIGIKQDMQHAENVLVF